MVRKGVPPIFSLNAQEMSFLILVCNLMCICECSNRAGPERFLVAVRNCVSCVFLGLTPLLSSFSRRKAFEDHVGMRSKSCISQFSSVHGKMQAGLQSWARQVLLSCLIYYSFLGLSESGCSGTLGASLCGEGPPHSFVQEPSW